MDEIKPWDWKRIFLGEAPPEFLIETLIRAIIVYFMLVITVRLLGKRMSGQISIAELAVMITLGAIISPGMQLPDRSIAFVGIALLIILVLHSLVNLLSTKYQPISNITEGKMICLVKNGIISLDAMKKARITRQELFAQLRQKNIDNLSNVDRVYLEACGKFSIYSSSEEKAGLLTYPEKDRNIFSFKQQVNHGIMACCNCGHVQNAITESEKCRICGKDEWIDAYQ